MSSKRVLLQVSKPDELDQQVRSRGSKSRVGLVRMGRGQSPPEHGVNAALRAWLATYKMVVGKGDTGGTMSNEAIRLKKKSSRSPKKRIKKISFKSSSWYAVAAQSIGAANAPNN